MIARRAATQILLSGCGLIVLWTSSDAARADRDDERGLLRPHALVISSSTYDPSQGAVASLKVGSPLAGTATAATAAVAGNDYLNVWKNASVDGSFGVTSAIELTAVEPHSGHPLHRLRVPAEEVVTSFSSKSELGLHFVKDGDERRLVFVAYAGAGVGSLDVSNSDAVAGQDPTNPVTFAFGPTYAFARTIVSVNEHGHLRYTPTINCGATTAARRCWGRMVSTTRSATPTTATCRPSARTERIPTSPRRRASRS